ncbi:hypothetical protein MKX01_003187 [Papaver californicum]|nr:hypothetical protein MKX01_003187 [Papaver californicum]
MGNKKNKEIIILDVDSQNSGLYWTFMKLKANWITKRQLGKFLCWCPRCHNKGIKMIVEYFMELFMRRAPVSGYPYFMDENWFSAESVQKFCEQVTFFCR